MMHPTAALLALHGCVVLKFDPDTNVRIARKAPGAPYLRFAPSVGWMTDGLARNLKYYTEADWDEARDLPWDDLDPATLQLFINKL